MLIIACVLVALSCLVAAANISGCVAAHRHKKKGIDKGYSNVPFLSLLFSFVAWLLGREQIGFWPFLPAAFDPGTWMTLCLPWVIWAEFVKKK